MGQYCLDANAFIQPWEQIYPKDVFSSLWKQIIKHKEQIIIIKNIFNEIDPLNKRLKEADPIKKKALRSWLENNQFSPVTVPKDVQNSSLLLERKYQTRLKLTKGADQNDITLIAYTKKYEKTLVTLEKYQNDIPKYKYKYKIPLICEKENVKCINYVQFLRELGINI